MTEIRVLHPAIQPFLDDEASRHRALWRGVIMQALSDAANVSAKPEKVVNRRRAQHWLLEGGSDFATVCDLAGFDPDEVRRKAREALQQRACTWKDGQEYRFAEQPFDSADSIRIDTALLPHVPRGPVAFATVH